MVAIARPIGDSRLVVIEWVSLPEWKRRSLRDDSAAAGKPAFTGMVAVLADRELGFEYPSALADLLARLEQLGMNHDYFLEHLASVTIGNLSLAGAFAEPAPEAVVQPALYVLVGTPSRDPIPVSYASTWCAGRQTTKEQISSSSPASAGARHPPPPRKAAGPALRQTGGSLLRPSTG